MVSHDYLARIPWLRVYILYIKPLTFSLLFRSGWNSGSQGGPWGPAGVLGGFLGVLSKIRQINNLSPMYFMENSKSMHSFFSLFFKMFWTPRTRGARKWFPSRTYFHASRRNTYTWMFLTWTSFRTTALYLRDQGLDRSQCKYSCLNLSIIKLYTVRCWRDVCKCQEAS